MLGLASGIVSKSSPGAFPFSCEGLPEKCSTINSSGATRPHDGHAETAGEGFGAEGAALLPSGDWSRRPMVLPGPLLCLGREVFPLTRARVLFTPTCRALLFLTILLL